MCIRDSPWRALVSFANGWASATGVAVGVGGFGVSVGVSVAIGVRVGVGMVFVGVGVGGTYGVGVKVAINTRVGPAGAVAVEVAVAALRGSSESAPPIEQLSVLSASRMMLMSQLEGAPARARIGLSLIHISEPPAPS